MSDLVDDPRYPDRIGVGDGPGIPCKAAPTDMTFGVYAERDGQRVPASVEPHAEGAFQIDWYSRPLPWWRRALTFIADYSGFRWLQDDFPTACLMYLAIGLMLVILGIVLDHAIRIGAL